MASMPKGAAANLKPSPLGVSSTDVSNKMILGLACKLVHVLVDQAFHIPMVFCAL